jgi:hypothetical protein
MKFYNPIFMLVTVLLLGGWASVMAQAEDLASVGPGIDQAGTDQSGYRPGETVSVSFRLLNPAAEPLQIKEAVLEIRDLSDRTFPVVFRKTVASGLTLPAKNGQTFKLEGGYRIPAGTPPAKAYGITVDCRLDKQADRRLAVSFFRVVDDTTLVTYDIRRSQYQGLEIFELTGGMSAEYAVQKSLATLGCGISHGWHGRQGGPEPVLSTPDFLQRSLRRTVGLYNGLIGEKTKVKTVIIGPGVPSVPYLATTMSAVYLPIHFLVSANSEFEIQSIVDQANGAGYSAYAVFGYDGSMPGVGVAWIKLLDLPAEYKKFIEDHQVEDVILYGVGEKVIGETCAQRVLAGKAAKAGDPGTVDILFTHYGSARDKKALADRIYDFDSLKLAEPRQIADWESGISSRQIAGFAASIKAATKARPCSITAEGDMIHLYDIAAGLAVKYIRKNEAALKPPYVKGVVFNEYLVSHPQYEIQAGLVPLLYWQFVPAKATVNRCFGPLKQAVARDYPEVAARWQFQTCFMNSNYGREELKKELIAKGIDPAGIAIREPGGDVWNPGNGMNAPCEKFAEAIVNGPGAATYRANMGALTPLTISEVQAICETIGGLKFVAP